MSRQHDSEVYTTLTRETRWAATHTHTHTHTHTRRKKRGERERERERKFPPRARYPVCLSVCVCLLPYNKASSPAHCDLGLGAPAMPSIASGVNPKGRVHARGVPGGFQTMCHGVGGRRIALLRQGVSFPLSCLPHIAIPRRWLRPESIGPASHLVPIVVDAVVLLFCCRCGVNK